jgi:hypothetical protein
LRRTSRPGKQCTPLQPAISSLKDSHTFPPVQQRLRHVQAHSNAAAGPPLESPQDECPTTAPGTTQARTGLARFAARLVSVYIPAGLVAASAASAARLGAWRLPADSRLRHAAAAAGRGALRLMGRVTVAGLRAGSLRAARALSSVAHTDAGPGELGGGGGGGGGGAQDGISWLKRGGLYLAGAAALIRPLALRDAHRAPPGGAAAGGSL